jgi:nucleoid DNA-binding protein
MNILHNGGLVRRVAKARNFNQEIVEDVLNELLEQIATAVAQGENSPLADLGTFYAGKRAAGEVVNISTGENIK